MYPRVNNNNRETTVLSCFQHTASKWGYPSRIRADNGGESIAVGEFMVWFRGENHGSVLTGPSVRNTRIGRLWRDVVECVVSVFHPYSYSGGPLVFRYWQWQRHVCSALHFSKNLKGLLDRFTMRFNYYSISATERNRTIRLLWASRCLLNYRSPDAGIRDVFDEEMPSDLDTYGNDQDGPPPDPDNVAPINIVF